MNPTIEHALLIAKSISMAEITDYFRGNLDFAVIEPHLAKSMAEYKNDWDRRSKAGELVIKTGADFKAGKITAGEVKQYFKLIHYVQGYYDGINLFAKYANLTLDETFHLFDLNCAQLIPVYCTGSNYLPDMYAGLFVQACPLVDKLDAVYEKDAALIREYGTKKGKLIARIYIPKSVKVIPEQYNDITGLAYFKIAAYLYRKEPSEELKAQLIEVAAKQVVLSMKNLSAEAEEALKKIAGADHSITAIVGHAFEALKDLPRIPITEYDDVSGCKQLLHEFYMGLALSGFKITELNQLFVTLMSLNDIIKQYTHPVLTSMCNLLAVLDNQNQFNNRKYLEELIEKTNLPREKFTGSIAGLEAIAGEEEKKTGAGNSKMAEQHKSIAAHGYFYNCEYKNSDDTGSIYAELERELGKLKNRGCKLKGLLIWMHPVYGHLQGWEMHEVKKRDGSIEIKHDKELFMVDDFHLEATISRLKGNKSDYERLITGENYNTVVDAGRAAIGNALIELHKNGKFKGFIASYPFSVYSHLEDEGKEPVMTVFEEKGEISQ